MIPKTAYLKSVLLFTLITLSLSAQEAESRALSLRSALKSSNPPIILDVRSEKEFAAGHIPSAINIPIENLSSELLNETAPDYNQQIYIYCKSGIRSERAFSFLTESGYKNVKDIQSIDNWLYGTIGDDGWSIGNPNAPIVVVEYIDLECPYCAQASRPHYELFRKYGAQIRFVFRHFPLQKHLNARKAHAALMAAGMQGYFWDYRFSIPKYFYDLSDDHLLEIASFLGLDIERFKRDMLISGDDIFEIEKNIALGKNMGVNSTPAFFVNGIRVTNPAIAVETLLAGEELEPVDINTSVGCMD